MLLNIILNIIFGAPLWVWPLLVALIWIGLRSARGRRTSVVAVYLLPLLGLISLANLMKLPRQDLTWPAYGFAYLIGAAWGYRLQNKWLLGKEGRQILLSGEWFTFAVLMVVFWMNFASGTIKAVDQQLYGSPSFTVLSALIVGVCSGTFAGRAFKVWRA